MYRFWWECSVIALLSCFFFCIGFCQMHSDFSTVCHSTTSRKSLWLSLVLPVTRSSKRYNRGCPSCRKNTSPSSQTFRVHHVTIFEEPYYRTCKLPVRAELMSLFMLNKKKSSKFFRFYVSFVTVNDCTISQNFLVSIKNPQEHVLEHCQWTRL